VQSAANSNAAISIKIEEEEICIKEADEPIAGSFSSVKDEPEVSPQTFHQYIGLLSNYVFLSTCVSTYAVLSRSLRTDSFFKI
jgi:hypothetical protein